MDVQFPTSSILLFLLATFFIVFIYSKYSFKFPKSYPLINNIVSSLEILRNKSRIELWTSELFNKTSSSTVTLQLPFRLKNVILTINPSNTQHILKTRINIYLKQTTLKDAFSDFLGNGLFLVDGIEWKRHRQILGHDANLKGFHNFVQSVTETVVTDRLLPFLSSASAVSDVHDLQDIFRRLTYDLTCKIGFSYDLEYLLPSFPPTPFADAYEGAFKICMGRFTTLPLIWKTKKILNTNSEKKLRKAVNEIKDFLRNIMKEKLLMVNTRITSSTCGDDDDIFDRIMARGPHEDTNNNNKRTLGEAFYIDEAINFILAGQETLWSAMTWFFWLVSTKPNVENEILREIKEKGNDNWKEMVYTHASICESMRLYPPVPLETRQAEEDDVLPDGTKVNKGMSVVLHILAMGRSETLWGSDWADFRPERWLKKVGNNNRDHDHHKWRFITRDPFTYPVFLAGPRTCLGKEIAFMQMKMIISAVLKDFRVIPSPPDFLPSYDFSATIKMKNGFPVRILER